MTKINLLITATLAAMVLAGCGHRKTETLGGTKTADITTVVDANAAKAKPAVTQIPVRFTDVSKAAGITWAYQNGATDKHQFIDSMGGGVAFLDYNNDGRLDIFAVQSGPLPGSTGARGKNALYRNNGNNTFTDVTQGSGLDADTGYGQGVSVADFDNDGLPDIYITAYGGNHLFRNNGNSTFTDITAPAGVADVSAVDHPGEPPWPVSSTWADYDNDGRLDLFVAHYCRWSPAITKPYTDGPQVYATSFCRLYHNDGNGVFTDVSVRAGLTKVPGKSLGAAWVDCDDDGWMDVFVTNDTEPNALLRNNHNGTFSDIALRAGVAYNDQGKASAGMGIGTADYDNDGKQDLFAVNFAHEINSVFHNAGHGLFENAGLPAGMAAMNLDFLGFGLETIDYDLDGYQDLVIGDGHILGQVTAMGYERSSYAQSQQLLHNQRDGTFADDQHSLGDLVLPRVTRGLAIGDYDNDGAQDVLMVSQTGPLQLFHNDAGDATKPKHWLTLRLEGSAPVEKLGVPGAKQPPMHLSNRDAVGAKVAILTKEGWRTEWVRSGSSYCSHSDMRLTFGLREEPGIQALKVRWPDGTSQAFGPQVGNRFYWLREGGQLVADPRVK